ncbi:MAG: hypothetical protein QOH78_1127 [Verrucomicrobiota bacterium]
MCRGQCSGSMFKAPAVRRHIDVFLDQVPDRGSDNQSHQFGPPVLQEESLHSIKAWYPAPAKCRPRCFLIGRLRVKGVRTDVSRIAQP